MRRHLFLRVGGIALAVGTVLWLMRHPDDPSTERADIAAVEAEVLGSSSTSSEPALTSAEHLDAREAVPVPAFEPAPEDPCAAVRAQLDAALALNADIEGTLAKINKKLAENKRELDRLKFDVDTPYGAFLADYESNDINDPYALDRIQDWLRQFPVLLRPGEATWIAERTAAHDWGLYGRSSEVALILFLGPARLLAELPPERAAELQAYYADESIFN